MGTAKELSLEFVRAFCDGDTERIGELLAEDFRFEGPLLAANNRAGYLVGLRQDPPVPGGRFDLLRAFEDGEEACLIYNYARPGLSLRIAQLTRCRAGKIASIVLVFDTR